MLTLPVPLVNLWPLILKSWHFEASKDIMTKFKSQGLHIIRIKYWKASGSDKPPSLIPALRKIAILGLKSAKRPNIFWGTVCTHQRSVEVQFGKYQKNILEEWSMVKNLSCVNFAAWNFFPINSLVPLSDTYLPRFANVVKERPPKLHCLYNNLTLQNEKLFVSRNFLWKKEPLETDFWVGTYILQSMKL